MTTDRVRFRVRHGATALPRLATALQRNHVEVTSLTVTRPRTCPIDVEGTGPPAP